MSARRLIHVTPARVDPDRPAGSAQQVWEDLARDFDELLVFGRVAGWRPRHAKRGKIRFVLLPSRSRRQWFFPFSSALLPFVCLVYRPSAILAQSPFHGGVSALAASRLTGARLIIEVHGDHYFSWIDCPSWFKRQLGRHSAWVARRADTVRAVSQLQRTQLQEKFGLSPARIEVVPYRVDTNIFFPARGNGDAGRPFSVMMACSLVHRKRVDVLLRALPLLPDRVEATIAGGGELDGELRQLARQLNVAERVNFAGQLTRDELADLMRRCDAFALLSESEAMPRALLEAMASGLAIVTTHVGVVDDLIEDGVTGLFVPLDDVEATARAIRTLQADGKLRADMSAACVSVVAASYSWEEAMRSYRRMVAGWSLDGLRR